MNPIFFQRGYCIYPVLRFHATLCRFPFQFYLGFTAAASLDHSLIAGSCVLHTHSPKHKQAKESKEAKKAKEPGEETQDTSKYA
jgi:mannose/fructose/N-acetylgalactosamine-specific phosphotransferase system component IIC